MEVIVIFACLTNIIIEDNMANTHLRPSTKEKLSEYCKKNTIGSESDGVDALFAELSAHKRETMWLRRLVTQYGVTEKLLEEKLKCCQKNQKTDTT